MSQIKLVYEGQSWSAARMKGTLCHFSFTNNDKLGDRMTWAVPTPEMAELAWRIYYAKHQPTREELYAMLSVIDSFRSLLEKDAKSQRALAKALLAAKEVDAD